MHVSAHRLQLIEYSQNRFAPDLAFPRVAQVSEGLKEFCAAKPLKNNEILRYISVRHVASIQKKPQYTGCQSPISALLSRLSVWSARSSSLAICFYFELTRRPK